ncbi:orotidine-5'-phosphate decarboxylase [Candidatus Anaplasma sp. TIGMIC]|uniref:orotidine-5'-phosphate decarboxylase n=1 Tax=Candidatus Anaplasma sp. TIGMIC TaxID=3020713 RepID=UPI00232B81B1|nr:orotidine-5'-phosphate decarboxylase [Candidatus Anaplasma sp. TIGMIC]MDB1135770.1 orotidine-5'-phosphate decarboxylase [Candidatus Anaplasma sp. TIGMIC]
MHRKPNPLICALDTADINRAVMLAKAVAGKVAMVKLGLEFFTAHGISGVQKIIDLGLKIFLDLKLHDIPNTVVGALNAVKSLDIEMLTIHISGGRGMIQASVDALQDSQVIPVGVTVLTSIDDNDMRDCGIDKPVADHVMRLVDLAVESGLPAIVCSAHEVPVIRRKYPSIRLVVPGIRVAEATNDQKRVDTPKAALLKGADYLVIGRAITQSTNPSDAVDAILNTL